MKVESGLIYRNKKHGTLYNLLAIGKHSETLGPQAIYVRVDGSDPTIWVRPMYLFIEKFEEAIIELEDEI